MKKIYQTIIILSLFFSISGCADFLELPTDKIFTEDVIFGDEVMVQSVLSDLYGTTSSWTHQHVSNWDQYQWLDEAERCSGGPETGATFANDIWRTYDYTYLRRINIFLQSLRRAEGITQADKANLEGQVRFLRAWYYFMMARGLGGMPIIGDEVFDYTSGMDITPMQYPRSTEAEIYDYIINECQAAYEMLLPDKSINAARANKWAAKLLEARAALYAGSLANYNNKMAAPIRTEGGEVGIPASLAQGYYSKALAAAEIVINNSPYELQSAIGEKTHQNLADNFYEALSIKSGNTEVIWARDYAYPGNTHGYTAQNVPNSHREDMDGSRIGIILNLVEEYELLESSTPGQGSPFISRDGDGYKFYTTAREAFELRDPRLRGTILYPGSTFRGREVVLQAGQLNKNSSDEWVTNISSTTGLNTYDNNGILITSENGPVANNEQFINKTGFLPRKFLDETSQASTRGRASDMWYPRLRISEAFIIACEASFELNNNAKATEYINAIRYRAGVQPLEVVTFDNIVHERRVEFVFEDHRYWDMKRWRLALDFWNGNNTDLNARHRRLFPYLIVAPGDPNNGMWVFEEDFSHMAPNARRFEMSNYYNFINQTWIDNNPKYVKNPFQ